jgi:hypothetical protein
MVGALRGPRDQGDTATVGPPSVSRSTRPPDIDADFARSNGMNVAAARQVAVSRRRTPYRAVVSCVSSRAVAEADALPVVSPRVDDLDCAAR